MTDEEEARWMEGLMENVTRLIDDATYLKRAERYPSAFVLATIAVEEVGKLIIHRWGKGTRPFVRLKTSDHVNKQWATACMVMAGEITRGSVNPHLPADQRVEEVEAITERFVRSESVAFFNAVLGQNLQRAKNLGLYEDQGGDMSRNSFSAQDVQYLIDQAIKAVREMQSGVTRVFALSLFNISPAVMGEGG